MTALLLYSLISTAMFYLGSRARITQAVWSRYPIKFARFMDCPMCVGFWWGLLSASFLGYWEKISFFGLDGRMILVTPFLVGLSTLVTTPILAGLMQMMLNEVGSAVPPEDDHA